MSNFPDKIRLKGLAEEDIYFAEKDRELLRILREKRLAKSVQCGSRKHKKRVRAFAKKFDEITRKHQGDERKRLNAYRRLIEKIVKRCTRRKAET